MRKYSRWAPSTLGKESWPVKGSEGIGSTAEGTGKTAVVNRLETGKLDDPMSRQAWVDKDVTPRRVMTPHQVNLLLDVVPARVHGNCKRF